MSRKSMTGKKVPINSWLLCEICHSHITSKDTELHKKVCQSHEPKTEYKHSFVKEGQFYVHQCQAHFSIEGISEIVLENVVQISDSAMSLCGFLIGDYVLMSFPNGSKNEIVRRVWPIVTSSNLEFIGLSTSDLNYFKGNGLILSQLSRDPIPMTEMLLTSSQEINMKLNLKDLEKALQHYLSGKVLIKGNIVTYEMFNKEFQLEVASMDFNEDDLSLGLERLTLRNSLYYGLVTPKTIVKVNLGAENITRIEDATIAEVSIGGINKTVSEITNVMNVVFGRNQLHENAQINRGILLYGPSGCGKSLLCDYLEFEFPGVNFIKINTSEIFSKYFGETELKLMDYFAKAYTNYPKPTVLVVEDVNNLCTKQDSTESTRRVFSLFLNCLDDLNVKPEGSKTIVIATTNVLSNVDISLRRNGRLDFELEISVPNSVERNEILLCHLKNIDHRLSDSDIQDISNITHGFVGADLASLLSRATINCFNRNDNQLKIIDINWALNYVKPSAMREVCIEDPNIKWSDIGGQSELKLKLKQAIEWPLTHPEVFEKFGIKPPRGILMFGPPGCSKTMIAKALASESKLNFLSIKGPELFSMWVGESERAVRELFRKARQMAPAILFFDEIDAIGGERAADGQSSAKERVLAQMLTEMDGVIALNNVTIVAATNRPDLIDKALMRPGRIDRIIYVPLPDLETRQEIFQLKLKKMPVHADVNIINLVERSKGLSGAEIQAICQEAALKALEESLNAQIVCWRHFEHALDNVRPRTSQKLLDLYDQYLKDFE